MTDRASPADPRSASEPTTTSSMSTARAATRSPGGVDALFISVEQLAEALQLAQRITHAAGAPEHAKEVVAAALVE